MSKSFLYSVLVPAKRQPVVCFPTAWGAGHPLELLLLRLIALPPHFHPRAEGSEAAQLAEIYAKLEEIEADKAPARYLKFPLSSHFTFPLCYLFQLGSSLLGHQSFLLDLALPLKCSSSPPGEWPLPFLTVVTVGSAPVLVSTHLSCSSVFL